MVPWWVVAAYTAGVTLIAWALVSALLWAVDRHNRRLYRS